jgi:hypothetical protein
MDTNSSGYSTSSYQHFPTAHVPPDYWHQTYAAWQDRLRHEQERARIAEAQAMRFFGGEIGDEVSLIGPMLKVVTDLFDGKDDYEDP